MTPLSLVQEAPYARQRHRAYNELGAVVLGVYLWAVFIADGEMRADLIDFLLADRFDSWWPELLADGFLWLIAFVVLASAALYPFTPFTSEPNWSEQRSGIYCLHILVNSICALALGWRAHSHSEWWSAEWLIPVGSAALALVELWRFTQGAGDDADRVDPRETGPRHGLVAWAFAAAAFVVVHRNGNWYWAESIAIGAMLAATFAVLLPLVLPLDPFGTRTRRSTGPDRGWQEALIRSDRDAQAFQAAQDREQGQPAGEADAGPPRP